MLGLAVAVSATPMVFVFGSAVNPSGLEIASAVCVWTGGLILVLEPEGRPPLGLIASTAVSASVMVLTRGLSPFWLAIIAVSLAVLAPRSALALIQWKRVRIAAGVVTLATAVAVSYVVIAHSLSVYPIGMKVPAATSQWDIVKLALGRTGPVVYEFVGSFDLSEISPPSIVVGLWLFSASIVVGFGLVASLRRHAAVIIGLMIGSLLIPTALMVSQAHKDGLVWQARDGFPLYAGILLTAGAVAGRTWPLDASNMRRRMLRRLAILLATTVALVQFGDLAWALRRYTVGLGTVVNPFAHTGGRWNPPGSSLGLFAAMAIGSAAYCWWIVYLARCDLTTDHTGGD